MCKKYSKSRANCRFVACDTVEGLVEGTAGIISLIADNIYGDTAELAGAINTNMIEYYCHTQSSLRGVVIPAKAGIQ